MDTDELALFVKTAQLGSITGAGRTLGLSAAVASARLISLEKRLGVRLMHRTTRRATLTEDGAIFLAHAQGLVEAAAAARAALGRIDAPPRGRIRIAAPASFGRLHVVPALADLLGRYPELSFDLRLSDRIIDLVEGGIDLAIRSAEPTDSTLIGRRLAPDRRHLVAAPRYLAERAIPTNPDDLLEHDCLVVAEADTWILSTPVGPRTIPVRGRLRIDDGIAVRDAAVAGLGIALMSTWAAGQELASGKLVVVLPDHPLVSEHAIWALYPSARLLPPKVRVVVDTLVERFRPQPYWDEQAFPAVQAP